MRRGSAVRRGAGRRGIATLAAALLPCGLLAACAVVGPTVPVQPGPGRTGAPFDADRRACMAQTDAQVQPVALHPGSTPNGVQALYDRAYGSCMAQRGNVVATAATVAGRPGLVGAGGDVPGMAVEGLRDADSVAARQSLAAVIDGTRHACEGERIRVSVTEGIRAPVETRLVDLSSPDGGACFGQPGRNEYVVGRTQGGWRTLLAAEPGTIMPLGTQRGGYQDLELRSLGQCTYVYRWSGSRYVQAGSSGCATAAPPTMGTLPGVIRRR